MSIALACQPRAVVVLATVLLFTPVPFAARADAPLPPPATVRTASPHGTCQAIAAVNPARIVVQARSQPDRILWSLPFWTPILVLSDDCSVLGAGYDRANLLTLSEKSPETVVMTFYRDGRTGRVIRLSDLYPDLSVLPRTASHWLWHQGTSWSGQSWTVHTVDGRTLSFAP